MRISQKTIEEIFSTAVIEEVIGDFLQLKKNGANYKGLSPFNNEKTPSFVVSPSKEIWKDFSSGRGGNLVSFLMEHEQLTYPEALIFLAKKYNIQIEYIELSSQEKEKQSERESTMIVLDHINAVFQQNIMEPHSSIVEYLKKRGFVDATLKEFEIGYCQPNDTQIISAIKKGGYNMKYLEKIQIINSQGKNRFSGRIIFPIHNMTGRVVGFGARILSDNQKTAKYLNSDSSDLYQKSKILYGLHLAKKHIKLQDLCYVVEGYTDVMALHQFGIKNVISPCGTAFTQEQIRLINRFTNNVVLLFDSDLAGEKATIKAINEILKQSMSPKVLRFPEKEDPASFIKKYTQEYVEKYIHANTLDFIQYKYSFISSQSSTEERIDITKGIISSLQLINDPISKSIYMKQASKLLDIDESILLDSLQKKITPTRNNNHTSQNTNLSAQELQAIQKKNIEEFQLIRLLIMYGQTTGLVEDNTNQSIFEFILVNFDNKDYSFSVNLFKNILDDIRENINSNKLSKDYFLNHVNKDISNLSAFIIGEKHLLSNWEDKDISVKEEQDILIDVITECLLRFKLKRVQEMVKNSLQELRKEQPNSEAINNFAELSALEKDIRKNLGRIT
jgi:DNA primase